MKSCSANSGAACSRPVLALVETARKAALGNRRGGLMRRWVSLHRFVLVLCASLCFAIASSGSAGSVPSAHPDTPAAQASLQQAGSSQSAPSESKNPEQTRTEQYTLSHERQANAGAYSPACLPLFFLPVFFVGLFPFF